jgi:hypothetical protein
LVVISLTTALLAVEGGDLWLSAWTLVGVELFSLPPEIVSICLDISWIPRTFVAASIKIFSGSTAVKPNSVWLNASWVRLEDFLRRKVGEG